METQRLPGAPPETSTPGRILAIDYGRRRIGVAVSDELGVTARPLENIERSNRGADMRRLREICREQGIRRIVVGQPLHINGNAGEMAQEAERYAGRLRKGLGLPVELLDERLTSWEAKEMIAGTGRSARKGESLDATAAAILLREYLERRRQPGCATLPPEKV